MFEKLESIQARYEELGQLLIQPETTSDMKAYGRLHKEYKDLEKIVKQYQRYQTDVSNLKNAKEMLATEKDPEFRVLAKAEIEELEPKIEVWKKTLKSLLIPRDPNDSKNVILEIRAGTGGDEAALFAGELFEMYRSFAETKKWKFSVLNFNPGAMGGFKEIIASIEGEDVYGTLKYESGAHRVQRVPTTESQGRVHTSAATVAIMPEAEEVDVKLNMGEVKKDTFRASGAGGQHINKTESAVRLTHIPSGIVVECQDGRSQHANYAKALKVLRSRLYEQEIKKQNEVIGSHRRRLVGSGDRSDKIRTYNFPQGRVTDHRIDLSIFNLPQILNGDIGEFTTQLRIAENKEFMNEELLATKHKN